MKHILENHIKNHVKSKKWLQYFLASLLIFVLTITGCGAVEENDNGNTGDTAVSKTVESEPDTLPEEASEPAEDGVYSS